MYSSPGFGLAGTHASKTHQQLIVFLLIVWAFSPLGSQLSLGLIKTENQLLSSNATIQHLDTTQPSKIYGPDDANLPEVLAGPINSIYSQASFHPIPCESL
ncbi:hypothetical protein BDZ45DRAFT_682405, partial [Acephala macrosclerotiorum]